MLFYAAQAVKQAGGFPVIVAPEDGPLRQEIIQAGMALILDESICKDHFLFKRLAKNFDRVVVNTSVLLDVVKQLSTIDQLKIIWWLHEAKDLATYLQKIEGVNWKQVHVLCVSAYAKKFIPPHIKAEILYNSIPDHAPKRQAMQRKDKLTFALFGRIEERKGQDIFVDAIALLTRTMRTNCRFILSGKLTGCNYAQWEKIEAKMDLYPEIDYFGVQDYQSYLDLLASVDVVVCSARDEPFSLVVLEAAMFSIPSIVSNTVGCYELFDETSSFSFQSGSVADLADKLTHVYENQHLLPAIGKKARDVFDKKTKLSIFQQRFLDIISTNRIKCTQGTKEIADEDALID